MTHTFGTNTSHASGSTNPLTFTFALTAADTVLCVMLKVAGATDRTGGALTYADLPMTQANITQKAASSPEASAELWYLLNPNKSLLAGTYTVSIPNAGSLTIYHIAASGRAPLGWSSALDIVTGANGTSASPAPGAVVTTQDGDIGFAVVGTGAQTWAPSAQAGTLLNNTDDGAHGTGRQYLLQTTKASINLGWTFATSDDWGAVVAFFKEVPAHKFNNYLGIKADSGISTVSRTFR